MSEMMPMLHAARVRLERCSARGILHPREPWLGERLVGPEELEAGLLSELLVEVAVADVEVLVGA